MAIAFGVTGLSLMHTINLAFSSQGGIKGPSTISVAVADDRPRAATDVSGSRLVVWAGAANQSGLSEGRPGTNPQGQLAQSPVQTTLLSIPAPSQRTGHGKVSRASFWTILSQDRQGSIQPARYVNKQKPQKARQDGSAADALIEAHQESLAATTEVQYTRIVQLCVRAMRHKTSVENQEYARHLAAWALNRRGQMRSDKNQTVLGLADFEAALKYVPNHWRALHNRGVTRAQSGQFEEAFDDFNRVVELNPQFAKAYSNRAALYVQAGDLQTAMEEYGLALELDDQLLAAQVGRARICHMLGHLEEAQAHFDAAARLDADNAQYVCSRADLLADMGHYRKAMADYAKAIELDPQFAHAYRNGAWLLATCPDCTLRDPENALIGAERALEFGYGQRHAALDTLAAAQANAGLFDEAVATVEQAIAIAPEKARQAYQVRLQFYQQGQPFRTTPLNDVQPVSHQE